MKNFTFLALAFVLLLGFSANAQQPIKRCVTEEKMQELFQRDPQAKLRYENMRRTLDAKLQEYLSNPMMRMQNTNAIINVPVVVHILIPNPNLVTDAIVQNQIDTLNWFYGGSSATDSLRVYTPFRTTYGRSSIRFCLAQRTPTDQTTNGIERVVSSATFTAGGAHPSSVVPAWNPNKYLNIWVVNFTDNTLGYSYKPGTWPAGDGHIGFVNDYRAFGSGGAYEFTGYNLGRTAVHEIGHFFNLDHVWGPNNNGNPTCTLDDGCTDTPTTNGPYFGCPTSVPVTSTACPSTGPDGIMWQNHMDYADDACMMLFTAQQCSKMDIAITTALDRVSLTTSNGCAPVIASANDAGISAIVSPTAGSTFCASSITPTATLKNYGTSNLTSVNINVTVNGVAQAGYPYAWTGNLSQNGTVNVTLPAINLVTGTNNIVISTSSPNGGADGSTANDASSVSVTRPTSVALPLVEGFETTPFPSTGWTLNNPDGSTTWQRVTGNAASGSWMAGINYYNYSATGQYDEIITPPINSAAGGAGPRLLSFARAYRPYSASLFDSLEVLVSSNCGASYTSVWKKWGTALTTTGGPTTASYAPAGAADWVTETVDLTPYVSANMIVKFKGTTGYGNNLFLDNINIQAQQPRDLQMVSINTPGTSLCSNNLTPNVTIKNNGTEAITNFSLKYRIDNGAETATTFPLQNLAPGASMTINLTAGTTVPGNHVFSVYVDASSITTASGSGDIQQANDTLRRNFTRVALVSPPVVEGFEGTFPPTGWTIVNPNSNITWVKKTPGRNSANSAFIDNYNYNLPNQVDDIRGSYLNVSGADSIIMSFDVAHKNYPGATDTLTVLVSTDCGNTFQSVYKKSGATLATAGSSTADYTAPAATDWRNERIALNNVYTASGSALFIIRNTNEYGNNIFIDNINLATRYKRDATITSVVTPGALVCNGSFTPSVVLKNLGTETMTGVKISYSIDNGTAQQTTLTGLNLANNAQQTVNLTAANVTAAGAHTFKVYSWEPVTASGTGDQNFANDTLTTTFSIIASVQAPFTEDFTLGNTIPAYWSVLNPDGSITWKRYAGGNGNPGSAYMNTYNYPSANQKDDLITPAINYTGVDSVKLTFDLSASTYSYPGSTTIGMDTLEVLVSKDCGNTYTSVYKKWGQDLQTIHDPNSTNVNEFFPGAGSQSWRKETIDLSSLGSAGPLLVNFRTTNNYENNIFIDNVNIATRTLPNKLKQQGYLVLPSPFQNSFNVWHYQTPSTLKYISVYNAAGQLIWTKTYNHDAQKLETVDLSGKAAGVYMVHIGYDDANRNVTERVVKY